MHKSLTHSEYSIWNSICLNDRELVCSIRDIYLKIQDCKILYAVGIDAIVTFGMKTRLFSLLLNKMVVSMVILHHMVLTPEFLL